MPTFFGINAWIGTGGVDKGEYRQLEFFSQALPLTGLSRNTLYSLLKAGEVPGARKLGNTWRFTRTTFFDWLGYKVS